MRSLPLIILFVTGFSFAVTARQSSPKDTACNFLKGIKFKNGTATITVKGYFHDYHRSADEPLLTALAKQKKLHYRDYGTTGAGGSALSFIPAGCSRRADGAINRNVKFDSDQIKEGDMLRITCLVFEDKSVRNRQGDYFYVIIGLRRINPVK